MISVWNRLIIIFHCLNLIIHIILYCSIRPQHRAGVGVEVNTLYRYETTTIISDPFVIDKKIVMFRKALYGPDLYIDVFIIKHWQLQD